MLCWTASFCLLAALAACSGERKTNPSAEPSPAEVGENSVLAEASLALYPELREDGPLARLYLPRAGRPFWLENDALSTAAREAAATLLDLAATRAPEWVGRLTELTSGVEACRAPGCTAERLLELELRLSAEALALSERQAHGRPRREAVVGWYLPPREVDVPALLTEGLATIPLAEALARFDPPTPARAVLEAALERYQALATAGGWAALAADPLAKTLKEGEPFDRAWLAELAARLAAEDYEAQPPATVDEPMAFYVGPLVEAVRRFQDGHGLVADGNLGKATLEALNVSVADRLRQLEVNLERLRWVKEPPAGRYLEVHVPAFVVEVREGEQTLYSTRVIVGKRDWPTPLFADEVSALMLNPPWNVPDSIAEDEILAKIQADPAYLAAENMVVVKKGAFEVLDPAAIDWLTLPAKKLPFRFRQSPGRGNLLGRIKLSLPNHHNIYLHDTPSRSLFERADRALSHGCVRVDKPFALADFLVEDLPEWRGGQLAKAAEAGKEVGIPLLKPVPVRILYTTVRAREDGSVVFYRDLYGLDATQ